MKEQLLTFLLCQREDEDFKFTLRVLEKWKEIAEFVKEKFYYYNKDSDFARLEVGKATFYEMIDCLNFQRSVIEQTIKEMDEKFLTK